MTKSPIYLDYNATTPLDPAVAAAMEPFQRGFVGNPSSRHSYGRAARRAIDQSRQQIAACLNADPAEVFFTSSATEANNQAMAWLRPGQRLLLSTVEHPSAMEPAEALGKIGVAIERWEVNSAGILLAAPDLGNPPALVVAQLANSETGAVQDIASLAQGFGRARFHCDAVQAIGKIPVDFRALGVSSLAISGHKIYGPPGIAGLLVRKDSPVPAMLRGGHQQEGVRAGTEPVALIVGLATAISLAVKRREPEAIRQTKMRDEFEARLLAHIPNCLANGPRSSSQRLANTCNISFLGAPAQALVMALDLAGVCVSAGSACASGSMTPSHVLSAMGKTGQELTSAVRFSFGMQTTPEILDQAATIIQKTVAVVRQNFPATCP